MRVEFTPLVDGVSLAWLALMPRELFPLCRVAILLRNRSDIYFDEVSPFLYSNL